jgi:urea ABC transporter ATP-binding protein UrtD
MSSVALAIKDVSKRFGGVQAIDHVNLTFKPGELRCVIGPNGAGKTTLFNLITGRIKPDEGRILFEGKDITHLKPYEISRLGIARKFQVPTVFDDLTILENLGIAAGGHQSMRSIVFSRWNESSVLNRVGEIMDMVHLSGRGGQLTATLSHGEKQWLEIGMVLAYQPRIMLLDEPTAGMSPSETVETSHIIRAISQNVTTVVIEHDIKFLREIAENVAVLHRGAIIAEGTFEEIENIALVREVYLGKRG